MQIRRAVEAGHRLRIGVAGDARGEIAQISAERRQRVDLHGDDTPVAIEAHARDGVVVARLRVGEKRFAARRGPLDRPAQEPRRPDDGGDLDRKHALGAEGAADVGRDHAQRMLGNMQRVEREPAAQVMGLLAGRIERVTVARGVVIAKVRARLDRIGAETIVVERELNHLRRRAHRRLGRVAIAALDLENEIAGELLVHERRAGRDGFA